MRLVFLFLCFLSATSFASNNRLDLWSLPEFYVTMSELADSMYIHGYNSVEVVTEFDVDDLSQCLFKSSEESLKDFKFVYGSYLSEVAIEDMKKVLSNESYYICWKFSFISEPNMEASQSFHSFISKDKRIKFKIVAIYAN